MMSKNDFIEKQLIFVNVIHQEKLCFSNSNLIVKNQEDQTKLKITCYKILAVYIIGSYSITSALIANAKKYGFSIFLLSQTFHIQSAIVNGIEGNTLLHRKQYEYQDIEIGKYIIQNKIQNQLDMVKSIRKKQELHHQGITQIQDYLKTYTQIDDYYSLMAIEGACAKIYFKCIFHDLHWHGRKPRVRQDLVNTTLDIGYSILFNYIDTLLSLYDFDVYVGVFHKEFYKRKSLVCDLMEPFRVLIDRQVMKSFHLKQFHEKDFKFIKNEYYLLPEARSKYYKVFTEVLIRRKIEIFIFIQRYYRAFMKGKEIQQYPRFLYVSNKL